MVKVFKDVFAISNAQSSIVQMAFYGGYATMAIPAALFIRKFSYKSGILVGLVLFATGALISIPAANTINFWLFIGGIYILTFGLAFLETTANPFILSMGAEETSTLRLNLAQAFNPIGSLGGAFIAASFVLTNVDFREGKIKEYDGMTFPEIQRHDLNLVSKTYMTLGLVVLATLVVFLIKKMPDSSKSSDEDDSLNFGATLSRLLANPRYVGGVITQMFYVGAQIMIWTFIIQYAEAELGMDNATAGNHQIAALVIFLVFRFICTAFLKYVSPGKLLGTLAFCGILCTLGAIHITGMNGLYSLMLVSACMSLMFPTIYGIALEGIGEDAKLGSAGLILAIVGAVWLTGFQGRILDLETFMGTTATRGSFYLSVGCFIVIAIYGFLCRNPRTKSIAA
ncbi:UNVERIFIED_CONTAM: hypothetical protein GTU68_018004 [Idotea baltica]|nr:hypothetical protein [Idotea baltica]